MKEWTIYVIALIVIFGCYAFSGIAVCTGKTQDMGFEHRYTLLGGCQIEVTPNQWIPLESYYFKQE